MANNTERLNAIRKHASNAWAWYRAATRNVQIIVGVVAVILVCGLCSCTLGVLTNGGGSPTAPKAVATHTAQPTATATATAAPSGPHSISVATLGGRESDFVAKYGEPSLNASDTRAFTITIQGQQVSVGLTLTANSDSGRAHFITLGPANNGATWNAQTELSIANVFIPTDAKYVRDQQVADFGLEHIYMSADLAKSLPAEMFTDASSGASVQPGTFYVACDTNVTPHGCSINVGQ